MPHQRQLESATAAAISRHREMREGVQDGSGHSIARRRHLVDSGLRHQNGRTSQADPADLRPPSHLQPSTSACCPPSSSTTLARPRGG